MDKIAEKLLKIKAVFIRPNDFFVFTASSNIMSPMYIDNRLTLSYPKVRTLITDEMVKIVKEQFPETEIIMGVATAGIHHTALVADRLSLPAGYVRSSLKGYGRKNQVEGKLEKGAKTLVIEDIISTGQSTFAAIDALKENGANIIGTLVVFSYQKPNAHAEFEKRGIKLVSLTNFESLIATAIVKNYITEEENKIIQDWKTNFNQL